MDRIFADRGALAVTVLGHRQHVALRGDDERHHPVPVLQPDAPDTAGGAAHGAHPLLVETHRLAGAAEEQDVLAAIGDGHAHQLVAVAQIDRDDAAGARTGEGFQRRLLDHAGTGGHEDVAVAFVVAHRQDGVDLLIRFQRQQIDDRLAAGVASGLRQFIDLEPVDLALIREAEDGVVGAGDEQLVDEVLVPGRSGDLALAAAPLRLIGADRLGLGITRVREGHHHVLFGDQVLQGQVEPVLDDLGAALVAVLFTDLHQLVADHLHQAIGTAQYLEQIRNFVQ